MCNLRLSRLSHIFLYRLVTSTESWLLFWELKKCALYYILHSNEVKIGHGSHKSWVPKSATMQKKIIKLTFSHWFFNSIIKNCSTCCSSESFCRWFLCCNFFLIFFTAGKYLIFYFINSWHYILVVIQKSIWSVTNFMWKRFQLVFNTV